MTNGVTRARNGRKSSNTPVVTLEIVTRSTATVWLPALGASLRKAKISSAAIAIAPLIISRRSIRLRSTTRSIAPPDAGWG